MPISHRRERRECRKTILIRAGPLLLRPLSGLHGFCAPVSFSGSYKPFLYCTGNACSGSPRILGRSTAMTASEYGKAGQLPSADGLYDPQYEHDACGVGFVAHIKGEKSHAILSKALDVLKNLAHRGACGCDPETGDGAGVLLQIPDAFFRAEMLPKGVTLPPPGEYGVGMLFLPTNAAERAQYEAVFAQIVAEEKQTLLGWRDVPVDSARIGRLARSVEPIIRQAFIARNPALKDEDAFERQLYLIRRRIQNAIAEMDLEQEGYFYVNSLSCRTVIYKGLLMA